MRPGVAKRIIGILLAYLRQAGNYGCGKRSELYLILKGDAPMRCVQRLDYRSVAGVVPTRFGRERINRALSETGALGAHLQAGATAVGGQE